MIIGIWSLNQLFKIGEQALIRIQTYGVTGELQIQLLIGFHGQKVHQVWEFAWAYPK